MITFRKLILKLFSFKQTTIGLELSPVGHLISFEIVLFFNRSRISNFKMKPNNLCLSGHIYYIVLDKAFPDEPQKSEEHIRYKENSHLYQYCT